MLAVNAMNIDITRLKSGLDDYITIDETYSFSKEWLEKTDIIKLDNIKITGDITKNNINEYIADININGTMILPCSITLKPTNYNFKTKIEGNLEKLLEEIGEKYENNQKSIDILPIIWENILLEIPIQLVSPEAKNIKIKGDGWELITDDEN